MSDISLFYDNDIELSSRTLYLGTEINEESASKIIKGILLLNKKNPNESINLLINSNGGDWDQGMAMFSIIENSEAPITATVIGSASSMATVILQACHERYIDKYAYLMLHDGTTGHEETHARNFERYAEQSRHAREVMYGIYASRSNKPTSYYRRLCQLDSYLLPEKALELELVDGIID